MVQADFWMQHFVFRPVQCFEYAQIFEHVPTMSPVEIVAQLETPIEFYLQKLSNFPIHFVPLNCLVLGSFL